MMFGQPNQLPEDDPDAIESKDLRKRARYFRRCKDVIVFDQNFPVTGTLLKTICDCASRDFHLHLCDYCSTRGTVICTSALLCI